MFGAPPLVPFAQRSPSHGQHQGWAQRCKALFFLRSGMECRASRVLEKGSLSPAGSTRIRSPAIPGRTELIKKRVCIRRTSQATVDWDLLGIQQLQRCQLRRRCRRRCTHTSKELEQATDEQWPPFQLQGRAMPNRRLIHIPLHVLFIKAV